MVDERSLRQVRFRIASTVAAWLCASAAGLNHACTTILVGKAASADGSVLMEKSCDGNLMGCVYVLPCSPNLPAIGVPSIPGMPGSPSSR